jgi:hypothetical protein
VSPAFYYYICPSPSRCDPVLRRCALLYSSYVLTLPNRTGIIPVTFTLRNFSLSRTVKCTLDLKPRPDTPLSSYVYLRSSQPRHANFLLRLGCPKMVSPFTLNCGDLSRSHLPASYTGQTFFRKTLRPLEICQIRARMAAPQPGVYGLGGWTVRCEIAASDRGEWQVGQVYDILAPEMEEEDVIVVHQAQA